MNPSLQHRCIMAFVKALGSNHAQIDFETDSVIVRSDEYFVKIPDSDMRMAVQAVMDECRRGPLE